MSIAIAIIVEAGDWPAKAKLRALARKAVAAALKAMQAEDSVAPPLSRPSRKREGHPLPPGERVAGTAELSIVFTDDAGMQKLNARHRGKDRPTNVLSFPQAGGPLLGDILLSAETVANEARLADKPLEDHMAHLLIHGFLHLLGHDHQGDAEAEKMEQLERLALRFMGISDPYAATPER